MCCTSEQVAPKLPGREDYLADAHWEWIGGLLETMIPINYTAKTVEYIYKTAFAHGYKHALTSFPSKQGNTKIERKQEEM